MSYAFIHQHQSNQPPNIRRSAPCKEKPRIRKVGAGRLALVLMLLIKNRIIKDFYLAELDPAERPKIFGMTASPVDAREDVVKAAK